MKAVLRKLNQESGFSLSEMLAAVLILLMVSGVVAAGVPAASNAYTKAVDAANAQVLLSTAATALRDELGTARNVTAENGSIRYYSADTGNYSELTLETKDGQSAILLTQFLGEPADDSSGGSTPAGGSEEVSWELVSRSAITKKLSLTYDAANVTCSGGLVTIPDLQVLKGDSVLAEIDTLVIDVVSAA